MAQRSHGTARGQPPPQNGDPNRPHFLRTAHRLKGALPPVRLIHRSTGIPGHPTTAKADRPRNPKPEPQQAVGSRQQAVRDKTEYLSDCLLPAAHCPLGFRRCTVPSEPVEQTKQVKAASDIVAVVGSYIPIHAAGKTFKAVCPFHTDTRPSLDVDPQRQRYKCW